MHQSLGFPPSTSQGHKIPQRGRVKQKRSRNNRGSLEQDSKKCTVDTDSEHGQKDPNNDRATPSECKDHTQSTGMSESDSSQSDTSSSIVNTTHLTGRLKPKLQKPLNPIRGPCSPQMGGRDLDPLHHTDPTQQLSVINLSSHPLSEAETRVLSHGLTFIHKRTSTSSKLLLTYIYLHADYYLNVCMQKIILKLTLQIGLGIT